MRIIAGSAKGRVLSTPKDASAIRPTSDRVRETIFNILGQWMEGLAVLDLFAGTGALGLEAVSRGAAEAILVDQLPEALGLCRNNVATLGFGPKVTVLASPVERALERLGREGRRFDLIFADPPYAEKLTTRILEGIARAGLLSPDGTLVLEYGKREEAPLELAGLERVDERRFGDTHVGFFKLQRSA